MRTAWSVLSAALAVAACGGHAGPPAAPAVVAAPAMRWVPAHPTYLFASAALGDAQHSLRDAVELLGGAAGYDLSDVVAAATGLLGVDPLHPDPLAAIGVDLRGGWAVFSEELDPTFVIHLAAPDQMTAFLEHQRGRGLVTQSVIVDQVEISTAALIGGVTLSWAIVGDWMWVHAAHGSDRDPAWLAHSRAPHDAAWSVDWAWAQRAAGAAAAASATIGLFDLHNLGARAVAHARDAVVCGKLVAPLGRAALAVDGDDHHFAARVTLDVGATDAIQRLVVAPPAGWAAASAKAAISGQWNLDLRELQARLAPCFALGGGARLDQLGVRTARGFVLELDPDQMQGSGALGFDLASSAFFEHELDRIPLRSSIERRHAFGALQGATLDIPFGPTVEYVLDPKQMIVTLGAGLLDRIVAGAPVPGPAPLFALDVTPAAMSPAAWAALFHVLASREITGAPGPRTVRMVERLMQWRDGHVALTTTPTELVLSIAGTRR